MMAYICLHPIFLCVPSPCCTQVTPHPPFSHSMHVMYRLVSASRQAQIGELGGLKLLLPLTQSKDMEVQRLAVHALANLSVDGELVESAVMYSDHVANQAVLNQMPTVRVDRETTHDSGNEA